MIRTPRLAIPKILEQKQMEWTTDLCDKLNEYYKVSQGKVPRQSKNGPKKPTAMKTRYAHAQIKQQLSAMFGKKCAFCESIVTAVSYQNVEHFRPKSIYPRLAYEWENLLFCCTVCNVGYKKDRFPLLNGNTKKLDPSDPCALDNTDSNALIDPTSDNPEKYFTFENERIISLNRRARITVDVCGLNRDDLLDERREWLAVIETTAKAILLAKQMGNSEEEHEFRMRLQSYLAPPSRYSYMAQVKLANIGFDMSSVTDA